MTSKLLLSFQWTLHFLYPANTLITLLYLVIKMPPQAQYATNLKDLILGPILGHIEVYSATPLVNAFLYYVIRTIRSSFYFQKNVHFSRISYFLYEGYWYYCSGKLIKK